MPGDRRATPDEISGASLATGAPKESVLQYRVPGVPTGIPTVPGSGYVIPESSSTSAGATHRGAAGHALTNGWGMAGCR